MSEIKLTELTNKREMALNLLAENVLTESGKEKVLSIINNLTKEINKITEGKEEQKVVICNQCKRYEECKKYYLENYLLFEGVGFCVKFEKKEML